MGIQLNAALLPEDEELRLKKELHTSREDFTLLFSFILPTVSLNWEVTGKNIKHFN